MPKELKILVNATFNETRVAVIEDGIVQELKIERPSVDSLVGNIYKAKVVRVIPGMQAAFVDIGLEKNGFLHSDDSKSNSLSDNHLKKNLIQDILHQGEIIWVQVSKDPFSDKGARLTMRLSLSTRNLVYLPFGEGISISQKITSKAEQKKLTEAVRQAQLDLSVDGGFIVRTLAKENGYEALKKDMLFLHKTWNGISDTLKTNKANSLVYKEGPLLIRTLREVEYDLIDSIWIDSVQSYNLAENFVSDFIPKLQSKIKHYAQDKPLFDLYLVEQQIQEALKPIVKLNNGGHLIIEHTAAMIVIDVNSGSYLGNKDQSETVLTVNLEATIEIARQIRLRNLSGIIVIDYIDMIETQHQQQVIEALENCLAKDKVKTTFSQFSPLGLIEISRQRTDENLEQIMCEKCNVCDGQGSVKSNETLCYDILRDILRQHKKFKVNSYTITTSSEIIRLLEDEVTSGLIDLQKLIDVPINLNLDNHYQQQYKIALN